jgi:hypothetical protein
MAMTLARICRSGGLLAALALALVAAPAVAQTPGPTAVTGGVADLGPTVATLSGSVNPNGVNTRYYFQYGPGKLNSRTDAVAAGSGTSGVRARVQVGSLKPATRYVYRLIAVSAGGTAKGAVRDFRTRQQKPTSPAVSTGKATNIADTGATLTGAINTRGQTGTYQFEYGPTGQYGWTTAATPFGPTSKGTVISTAVGGLTSATRYHYRLVFQPTSGNAIVGRDRGFITKRTPNGLLIDASPNPVRYSRAIRVGGVLAGSGNTGVEITVQADPFPFDGAWSPVATGRTDATGAYVIEVSPLLTNTQFRTVAATRPQVVSQAVPVDVRLGVSLHVKRRPHRGARVRFHGRVSPRQNGASVRIQRRVHGRYRTIGRTHVRGSRYSTRVRVRHSGRYRAYVSPINDSHVAGKRTRMIRVRR